MRPDDEFGNGVLILGMLWLVAFLLVIFFLRANHLI